MCVFVCVYVKWCGLMCVCMWCGVSMFVWYMVWCVCMYVYICVCVYMCVWCGAVCGAEYGVYVSVWVGELVWYVWVYVCASICVWCGMSVYVVGICMLYTHLCVMICASAYFKGGVGRPSLSLLFL